MNLFERQEMNGHGQTVVWSVKSTNEAMAMVGMLSVIQKVTSSKVQEIIF